MLKSPKIIWLLWPPKVHVWTPGYFFSTAENHQTRPNLSEAGGVDGLCVIGLTVIQVVDIQGTPGYTHAFCYLVVLLQPVEVHIELSTNMNWKKTVTKTDDCIIFNAAKIDMTWRNKRTNATLILAMPLRLILKVHVMSDKQWSYYTISKSVEWSVVWRQPSDVCKHLQQNNVFRHCIINISYTKPLWQKHPFV